MSNFSNLGFEVTSESEFQDLVSEAYELGKNIPADEGRYVVFSDDSGAELWIQISANNEFIGANPHFNGRSRRQVSLVKKFGRPESELDGAYYCWADPSDENNPESGAYPFVFDLPDFRTENIERFPQIRTIQLAAFAQELSVYDSEANFDSSQTSEIKFGVQSFIPSGLFAAAEDKSIVPPALGFFTGLIRDFEKKENTYTRNPFYWLLVETLGGMVDVVADIRYFEKEPRIGGVVQGQFWLSGRLM